MQTPQTAPPPLTALAHNSICVGPVKSVRFVRFPARFPSFPSSLPRIARSLANELRRHQARGRRAHEEGRHARQAQEVGRRWVTTALDAALHELEELPTDWRLPAAGQPRASSASTRRTSSTRTSTTCRSRRTPSSSASSPSASAYARASIVCRRLGLVADLWVACCSGA